MDLIHNFKSLEVLHLYISEETELFPSLSHIFDSLLELKIVIYGWTRIPKKFDNFPNLKKLKIFGGKILHSFDSILSARFLEILEFHDVQISKLPDSIGDLKNIKKIQLDKHLLDE